MKALSLFSGIGGLDLAAEASGIETVARCELDPFCRKILTLRFHNTPIIEDVRAIQGDEFKGVDIIHGGFPCQDLSAAGLKKGLEGEKSKLWFEMLRIIGRARPRYVVAENVYNAVNLALDRVVDGLEKEGYEVWPIVLPAAAFGAPHERKRLCVLAIRSDVADACGERLQGGEWGGALREQGSSTPESTPECCAVGGLWPTPTVYGNHNRKKLSKSSGDGLSTAVKMWRTPVASDACHGGPNARDSNGARHLSGQVTLWPTPTTDSLAGGSHAYARMRDALGDELAKKMGAPRSCTLNPDWEECLMGYPVGWTDPDCLKLEEWPGWPAGMGPHQYDYEPPRLTDRRKHRVSRVKALGNAVVPQQFTSFFEAIRILDGGER